jgi:hypothetical protein
MSSTDTVEWCPRRKHFTINGKAVPGLHPTLKACFYPTYSFSASRDIAAVATPHAEHAYYGMRAGIKLDTAITKSVEDFVRTNVRPNIAKLPKAVRHFWLMCEHRGWTPTGSQVTVGCSILQVATRADVVCAAEGGGIVLLEIKSGYSYCQEGNAMLKAPYTDRRNSPLNQHHLQLLLSKVLYQRTHPSHVVTGCYICRFEPGQVDIHPLAAWALDKVATFLSQIEHKKSTGLYRNRRRRTGIQRRR